MQMFNDESKMNEIIFQNRNKSYGAYVIRNAYHSTLMKACFFVSSGTAAIIGSIMLVNHLNGPIMDPVDNNGQVMIYDTMMVSMMEPEQLEQPTPEQPKPETPASAAPNTAVSTIIDEHAVETHSVDVENPTPGQGNETSTGTSLTSTETTTNTSEVNTFSISSGVGTTTSEVSFAEEMPEFKGGMKALVDFISSNLNYPAYAMEAGKEGTVYVSFVVDELGFVSGAKIYKGIGFGCDEEAIRVVNKMPKWEKPGKNGGHAVRVRFNLPISFKLRY